MVFFIFLFIISFFRVVEESAELHALRALVPYVLLALLAPVPNVPFALKKGIIEFENYFKQIPVPFKVYADFECNLRSVECYEGFCTKKYQDHIPCSFA